MNEERILNDKRLQMRVETKEEIIQHLLKSEDDIEHGRVRDAREVFKEWGVKYDI